MRDLQTLSCKAPILCYPTRHDRRPASLLDAKTETEKNRSAKLGHPQIHNYRRLLKNKKPRQGGAEVLGRLSNYVLAQRRVFSVTVL